MKQDVAVCIPTWRSAAFIGRTLACARAQTHGDLRIVVSVDPSDDGTAEACRRVARQDARIEVLEQGERLGWSQNANAALDRAADAPFRFLYFHDDVIEPTYVDRLLRTLAERPDAASAHCDLVEFGLAEELKPAHSYEGTALQRIADFLLTQRGTTLRSLIRGGPATSGVRFPRISGDGPWAAYVFHLRLLAAGPAVGVREPLYRRWQRAGSLTRSAGWEAESVDVLLQGQREAAALCLELIDAAAGGEEERAAARYCLRLFQLLTAGRRRLRLGDGRAIEDAGIAERLGPAHAFLVPGVLEPEAEAWVARAEEELRRLDGALARARGAGCAASAPRSP